jgi:hypothetical protein
MLELAGVLVDQISAASRPALQRSFQLFTGLQLLGRRVADKGGPARAPGQPEETRVQAQQQTLVGRGFNRGLAVSGPLAKR